MEEAGACTRLATGFFYKLVGQTADTSLCAFPVADSIDNLTEIVLGYHSELING